MDVAALIVACTAIVLFLIRPIPLGMALLSAALVCQFVHLTGHLVVVN